jgi:hypothetical protein
MNTTLPVIETVEPHEPTILVRMSPGTIGDLALVQVREVCASQDRESDCLRAWLRGCVDAEIARRTVEAVEVEEPAAWLIPWHRWTDKQLAAAMAASYSWYDVASEPTAAAVLREVHRAVLTAACTRLGELHEAIERAQSKRG